MYLAIRLPIAFGLLAAVAALSPSPAVVLVIGTALLIALLGADVARAPRAERLQLGREAPRVAGLGRAAAVDLRLHNPTERRLEVTVRDLSPSSLRRAPDRHQLSLSPGGWAVGQAQIRPSRRGR